MPCHSRWVRNCVKRVFIHLLVCLQLLLWQICREFKIVAFLRKLILKYIGFYIALSLRFHGALCLCRANAHKMGHAGSIAFKLHACTYLRTTLFSEGRERMIFFSLFAYTHIKFLINVRLFGEKESVYLYVVTIVVNVLLWQKSTFSFTLWHGISYNI